MPIVFGESLHQRSADRSVVAAADRAWATDRKQLLLRDRVPAVGERDAKLIIRLITRATSDTREN